MPIDIYAEEIVSHYEHPHNKGEITDASVSQHNYNPVCGDEMTMYLMINDGIVSDVKFKGVGCAISMATASMLTDFIKGKTLKEIEGMGINTIIDLIGIDPGPARLKCATLSLRTLKEAVFVYEHKEVDRATKEL
ncbi:MAG: SUF system NifU family Fe-S cluster assembly protein [Candidatus Micrarchaeota archaeon]|nr:SUF system NifU family Fe-S cluster assembly protein [Candidatus Micrarchaeota archaeon]